MNVDMEHILKFARSVMNPTIRSRPDIAATVLLKFCFIKTNQLSQYH